jgi:predicted Ser/Thr protein kinase
VCLYVYIAGQRLRENVTAAKNTQATIEKVLEASFSMHSSSYQRKAGY